MTALKGKAYLQRKLGLKRIRVLTRYDYYDQHLSYIDLGKLIPKQLSAKYNSVLGWCTTSVDSLADRLTVAGFDGGDIDFTEIYRCNNPDILFDSAILSALIGSCSFIYIADAGTRNCPHMQVIDGANATGILDPTTGLLTEGYAVLSRDADTDAVTMDAYFLPGETQIDDFVANTHTVYRTKAPAPLLVPIIYRPDARRPFGHSRISRACMNLTNQARAIITRADVTAEFYSYPQRYVLGLSDDAEFDGDKATISSFLAFGKDEDRDRPQVGQFNQQSMTPHLDQLNAIASAFCGETGLTLNDLGFEKDNPSSADAIKASHESLRLQAKKAQRCFGTGFLNAGYLAACVWDDTAYDRIYAVSHSSVKWSPIFEPDASQLSGVGDAVGKINTAIPGYFDKCSLEYLTGIKAADGNEQ